MTRWDWLGPLIGAVLYITGLTQVIFGPIERVFFSFSDPVKFIITIVVATIAVGLVSRSLRNRRRKLVDAKARVASWHPPETQT